MRRWLARMSDMRVRNTPGAPLLFRPRLRYALRAGPGCLRGPRDKLPRDSGSSLSLSLSLLTSCKLARDLRLSRIERPRGHTPSSREPAGRRKEGDDGPSPCAPFCVSGIVDNLVSRRGSFCNFYKFGSFFGTLRVSLISRCVF